MLIIVAWKVKWNEANYSISKIFCSPTVLITRPYKEFVQGRQILKEEGQQLLAHNDSQCHCWSEVSGLNTTRWKHTHTHLSGCSSGAACADSYTPVSMYIPDFVLMYMNVCRPLLVIRRIFFFVRAVLGLSAVFLFKHMTGNIPFYYILLVWVKLTKLPKDFSIDLWYLFQFCNLKSLSGAKTTWQPWKTEKDRSR